MRPLFLNSVVAVVRTICGDRVTKFPVATSFRQECSEECSFGADLLHPMVMKISRIGLSVSIHGDARDRRESAVEGLENVDREVISPRARYDYPDR